MEKNKLFNFLSGKQVLEEKRSPVSGRLAVVRDLAWGTYIMAGGLTQSGGVAKTIWQNVLRKVWKKKKEVTSCLILGLGGGSIAKITRKLWKKSKITGVEIDPVIIELGEKYLGLKEIGVNKEFCDAEDYLKTSSKVFDLICVDTYVGDSYPKKFEEEAFLVLIRKHLDKSGIVIFNRLYYGDKRPLAMKFLKRLESVFSKVEIVFPEANVMFICQK